MYQKFNKDVSDLLNCIYDEKSGEELLPLFGQIVTSVYKMNYYFGFGSELISEVIHFQVRDKIMTIISQLNHDVQMYGLVWGYKQAYCKGLNIASPYVKDDFFLICQ